MKASDKFLTVCRLKPWDVITLSLSGLMMPKLQALHIYKSGSLKSSLGLLEK